MLYLNQQEQYDVGKLSEIKSYVDSRVTYVRGVSDCREFTKQYCNLAHNAGYSVTPFTYMLSSGEKHQHCVVKSKYGVTYILDNRLKYIEKVKM